MSLLAKEKLIFNVSSRYDYTPLILFIAFSSFIHWRSIIPILNDLFSWNQSVNAAHTFCTSASSMPLKHNNHHPRECASNQALLQQACQEMIIIVYPSNSKRKSNRLSAERIGIKFVPAVSICQCIRHDEPYAMRCTTCRNPFKCFG